MVAQQFLVLLVQVRILVRQLLRQEASASCLFFILRKMIIRGVFGKILSQSFTEAQSFSYALFGFFPQRRSCLGMEISELRQEFVYRRIERRSPNFRRTFKKYRFGRELQNLLVLGIFSERQRISGIMAYDIWIKIHQFMYC